jgi:aerobic carbon-monoxide dehydrogenase small subunit
VTSRTIRLDVNGVSRSVTVEPRRTLADVLREELALTGTHVGCEHGVCGACTVLWNGEPVRACLLFAIQLDGASLTTVEGLADGERLHPIQEAFWATHGLQCGFCTPGLLLTAKALLDENPNPDETEIREAISGNLCRCTGYHFIVQAIRAASRLRTST